MRYVVLFMIVALSQSSCQQRLYFPDRANTPMLSRALEAKLTVAAKPQSNYSDSLYGGGGGSSVGVDAAFAPLNHIGLIVSYRDVNRRRIDEEFGMLFNTYGGVFTGHRWEGGAGYFTPFGKLGRAEAYAGYGNGELTRRGHYTPERDYSTRYHRYFVQGAAGAGNHFFTASGGLRFAFQKFYGFTSPNPDLRYQVLDLEGPRLDVQGETFGFMEPFINGEAGWKILKFNIQFGTSAQFMGDAIAGNTPFYFSIGATLHFVPDYLRKGAFWQRPAKSPGKSVRHIH